MHTGCRHCTAVQPAEPAAHWWPLRLVTFCAALWFIFAPNSSGKARRGGQEPRTGAAAPSPPPGLSKAGREMPASSACHWRGYHAPTKSSQPLWMITTQRDRSPAPIWTLGEPTTTQSTTFPFSKGSDTSKTQALPSLGASAREGCWRKEWEPALSNSPNSEHEERRDRERKAFLTFFRATACLPF